MEIQYNIRELYRVAFGYIGLPFPLLEANQKATSTETDVLGRPIHAPLYLNDLYIENSVVVISGGKRIVETAVSGGRGTVKELTGIEDFQISIRGVLVSDTELNEKVRVLAELLSLPEVLKVKHDVLNSLGVYDVVVYRWEMPENKGYTNIQGFTISAKSEFNFVADVNESQLIYDNYGLPA